MDDNCITLLHDSNLASRKAEEAAWRRILAAKWLEDMAGPLNLPNEPSEHDFLSCLRSGIVLCNTINKVVPGSVAKVIMNHSSWLHLDVQPLIAYQYFENVRNFLDAMEELKLPTFEASDLERDTKEAGAATKIVDSILSLKSFYEWKQLGKIGDGPKKDPKSPVLLFSANRVQSGAATLTPSKPCRQLHMSDCTSDKQLPNGTGYQKLDTFNELVDSVVKAVADCMLDSKENIDTGVLHCYKEGNTSAVAKIISGCLQDHQINKILDCFCSSPKKGKKKYWRLLEAQENDLMVLKNLHLRTREEFKNLQIQLQNDLIELGNQIQCMSAAALGYQQIVEENRNLYNTLQDLKGNIRVSCRIRPIFVAGVESTIDFVGDDGSLIIRDLLKFDKGASKVFQFNQVFGPNASQEEVFHYTKPLIRSVIDGYNVCILAYGQTGSGKTYTMCGPSTGSCNDKGINYLALNDLFQLSCQRRDLMKYEFQVQMVEIYNEQVRDLLAADASVRRLEIRSSSGIGNFSLPDANMYPVHSIMDVFNLMKLGQKNRAVSSTAVNDSSSRSHSILIVHMKGQDKAGNVINSSLYLVDLAGSERVDKSEVVGERLKEAQHINRSLSCLGDVITALAQKNTHIPYRNSKLTQLLQNSLGGQAKMLMIAHVSPEAESYGETLNTLKFAQRVSTVELGAARLNKESYDIQKLRDQVDCLKKELSRNKREKTEVDDLRSPSDKVKKNQLTPPRPRRFSIEGQSVGKPLHLHKQTPKPANTPNQRSRRLSLEGSKYGTKSPQPPRKNFTPGGNNASVIVPNTASNEGEISGGLCTPEGGYNQNIPSHFKAGIDISITKIDSKFRTPIQPKSPEASSVLAEKTQGLLSSNARKGSQIRKSFLSIGKFINGPEKRKQSEPKSSPINIKNNYNDAKSSEKKSRTARRQSLTGDHVSALRTSQRASLGGKLTDSYSSGTQSNKTPSKALSSLKTRRKL